MGKGVLTSAFAHRAGALHCEDVPLERIARAAGTPTFVYSAATIRQQHARLSGALHGIPHRIHYTLKANANRAILELLRGLGSGVDVVSGGELFRAPHAGYEARDVIFGGVGKSARELGEAVHAGELFAVRLVGALN